MKFSLLKALEYTPVVQEKNFVYYQILLFFSWRKNVTLSISMLF